MSPTSSLQLDRDSNTASVRPELVEGCDRFMVQHAHHERESTSALTPNQTPQSNFLEE